MTSTYDPRETALVDTVIARLGPDAILRPGMEVVWHGDECALADAETGHSFTLTPSGHLLGRMTEGNVVSWSTIDENGEFHPVGVGPLGNPDYN
jgi:hypothetical protein